MMDDRTAQAQKITIIPMLRKRVHDVMDVPLSVSVRTPPTHPPHKANGRFIVLSLPSFMPLVSGRQLFQLIGRSQPIAALDVGLRFVGLSISDTFQRVAMPMKPLRRSHVFGRHAEELRSILGRCGVEGLIVGYALNPDGTPSLQCSRTLDYLLKLEAHNVSKPTVLWDETHLHIPSYRFMKLPPFLREGRYPPDTSFQRMHPNTAVWLLQNYLDDVTFFRLTHNHDESFQGDDGTHDLNLLLDIFKGKEPRHLHPEIEATLPETVASVLQRGPGEQHSRETERIGSHRKELERRKKRTGPESVFETMDLDEEDKGTYDDEVAVAGEEEDGE